MEPKLTREQEAELIAGLISREPVAERRFFEVLRPLVRIELRSHWPRFWQDRDDLEQDAMVRLLELREREDAWEKIRPPLVELAKALVEKPARILRRAKKALPLKQWEGLRPPSQEQAVELQEMLREASKLTRGAATTLLTHAAHETGDGPEVHEVLGIDKESARKRLLRAQAALYKRISKGEDSDD